MKSDQELAEAIVRMTRALGARCASGDPDTAFYLNMVQQQLDAARSEAVAGWRRNFSDGQIARELGVTKQAVQKRWPRELVEVDRTWRCGCGTLQHADSDVCDTCAETRDA